MKKRTQFFRKKWNKAGVGIKLHKRSKLRNRNPIKLIIRAAPVKLNLPEGWNVECLVKGTVSYGSQSISYLFQLLTCLPRQNGVQPVSSHFGLDKEKEWLREADDPPIHHVLGGPVTRLTPRELLAERAVVVVLDVLEKFAPFEQLGAGLFLMII